MSTTVTDAARTVVAEHARADHHAGDGYTEPREAWIDCSCGAQVWQWQQYYFETTESPDESWLEHLSAMTAGHFIMSGMSSRLSVGGESCQIPEPENEWLDFF